MEKQVIFRDNQELQAADLNDLQDFAAQSLGDVVRDCVTTGTYCAGLEVTASGVADISIAPGRLYVNGAVYVLEQSTSKTLFSALPLVTARIATVVAWGQTAETQTEPRDFLIDPLGDATEPRAVAMVRHHQINLDLVLGAESADPQPPAVLPGVLAVADVRLSPTGIVTISARPAATLPSVAGAAEDIARFALWRALAEPRIAALSSDLAALAERTGALTDSALVREMARDIARLKERAELPDTYAAYGSDAYGDEGESDSAYAGYSARVLNGVSFPYAASDLQDLALFNPIEPLVARQQGGSLILPAYTSVLRLATTGYVGDVPLNQYPSYALPLALWHLPGYALHYGWHYTYTGRWYSRYGYTYYSGWRRYLSPYLYRAYQDWGESAGNTTFTGSALAQTLIVNNAMVLSSLGLYFTAIDTNAAVNVALVMCVEGKPDASRVVAAVTIAAGDIKRYPQETQVPLGPVFLESGTRYAIIVSSGGAHRLALVNGGVYTDGTLFFGTDGQWSGSTVNRDLMFSLYAAQFASTRTEVPLQSASLAGGMTDLDIAATASVPDGTDLFFEVQVGGLWRRLGDGDHHLAAAPDLVPLRAVFLGTRDLQPIITMGENAITVSRAATALTHVSTERTLPGATTKVQVRALVDGYNEDNHDLACALIIAGSPVAASTVADVVDEDGVLTRTWTFNNLANPTAYRIKLTGARGTSGVPFAVLERMDVAF